MKNCQEEKNMIMRSVQDGEDVIVLKLSKLISEFSEDGSCIEND